MEQYQDPALFVAGALLTIGSYFLKNAFKTRTRITLLPNGKFVAEVKRNSFSEWVAIGSNGMPWGRGLYCNAYQKTREQAQAALTEYLSRNGVAAECPGTDCADHTV